MPRHKHDIANRLVQGALSIAYQQKDVLFQGPFPSKYLASPREQTLTLYFAEQSISVRNDTGFEVGFLLWLFVMVVLLLTGLLHSV